MGNLLSCQPSDVAGGKVMLPDGTVSEFGRPISVAELMLEHPRHFVVDMQSLSCGRTKAKPLPADHMLEPDNVYVMLPMARGKPGTVSADDARRILQVLRSSSSPVLARGIAACMRMLGDAKAGKKVAAEEEEGKLTERGEKVGAMEWSSDVLEERPEFLSRQLSGKGWKPSLGTIEETGLERKMPHWLF